MKVTVGFAVLAAGILFVGASVGQFGGSPGPDCIESYPALKICYACADCSIVPPGTVVSCGEIKKVAMCGSGEHTHCVVWSDENGNSFYLAECVVDS